MVSFLAHGPICYSISAAVFSPLQPGVDFCRATHSYPRVRTSVPGPRANLRVFSSRVPFPLPDDPLGSHPLSAACRHKQLFPFPKPTDCPCPYIGLQAQLFRRVSNNSEFLDGLTTRKGDWGWNVLYPVRSLKGWSRRRGLDTCVIERHQINTY
jgi:hypothetical protein